MPLDVEVRTSPSYSLVVLAGELDLSTSGSLQGALASFEKGSGPLVVDLSEVSFLDSSALRVLVQVRLRVAVLRLIVTRPNIRRVFDVSGLADVFELYETEGDAAQGL